MLEIHEWPETSRYNLTSVLYAPSQPKKISLGVLAWARRGYAEARAKEEGTETEWLRLDTMDRWDYASARAKEGSMDPKDYWYNFSDRFHEVVQVERFKMVGYVYKVKAYVR